MNDRSDSHTDCELPIGAAAPDLEIELSGTKVRLSELWSKGPLVLLFYPLAFTPVCIEEFEGLREGAQDLQSSGATFLAVSVDSPPSASAFARNVGFENISFYGDLEKRLIEAYKVERREGFSQRATVVVDSSGKVQNVAVEPLMSKRTPERILQLLRHLPS